MKVKRKSGEKETRRQGERGKGGKGTIYDLRFRI
jgi:hypothetical protein